MPMRDVLLRHFRKCSYTCEDTQLHSLVSYVLLIGTNVERLMYVLLLFYGQ